MTRIATAALAAALGMSGCGGSGGAGDGTVVPLTRQESQCVTAGWSRLSIVVDGTARQVLWKAPPAPWTRGAIVVLHGGGGSYTNFCAANVALIEPQVRFAAQALEAGFAVFLPDSSDRVTDDAGRLCGKVWDDEPRTRPNVDLPFIGALLAERIAALRPAGSASAQFVVGHSSGGFMAVRAARRFGDRIAAFASVAGGDPYGWYRDCTPRPTDRPNVFGGGFDRETRRQIVEPGACDAEAYPQEQRWDDNPAVARPPFRVLHHEQDGILDRSCVDKQRSQLRAHGHLEHAPLTVQGGPRSADVHYWLDAYNAPLIDYFARGHSVRGSGAP